MKKRLAPGRAWKVSWISFTIIIFSMYFLVALAEVSKASDNTMYCKQTINYFVS